MFIIILYYEVISRKKIEQEQKKRDYYQSINNLRLVNLGKFLKYKGLILVIDLRLDNDSQK